MNWEPVYALLLLTSTGITYIAALGGVKFETHKTLILTTGIVLNLLILFFFKYFNFAAENVVAVMSYFGVRMYVPEFKVLLPVGISFYIFQALGYMIDVHRGDVKPEKNFFTYALFVSFFPQLVAGPIERSKNLLTQFYQKHKFDAESAVLGINLMLWGYFLKLVVADRCAIYVDAIYNNMPHHNGGSILIASILFCFQLYGDFAGYSYIAIGCSRVLGFKLMDNFQRPYFFSISIQDYWRRNHISLTSWFMDYVYYPMVGSSTKLWWWCLAIFITFFISGFWHGAAWTYVLCFSIHGFYLVVCILKEKRQRKFEKKYGLKNKEWWIWVNRIATFFLVVYAVIFFRSNNLSDALIANSRLFSTICNVINFQPTLPFLDFDTLVTALFAIGVLFMKEYCEEYNKKILSKHKYYMRIIQYSIIISIILLFGVFDSGQFIYFQF